MSLMGDGADEMLVVSSAPHLEFLAVNFFLPPRTRKWFGCWRGCSETRGTYQTVHILSNPAQAQLSAGQLQVPRRPVAGACVAGPVVRLQAQHRTSMSMCVWSICSSKRPSSSLCVSNRFPATDQTRFCLHPESTNAIPSTISRQLNSTPLHKPSIPLPSVALIPVHKTPLCNLFDI